MTKIFLALFFFGLACTTAHAVEEDKVQHFTASAAISSTTYLIAAKNGYSPGRAYTLGIGIALTAGILKEWSDASVDRDDLIADVLGATTVPFIFIAW